MRGRRAARGSWNKDPENLDDAWRHVEGPMAEIEAGLESAVLDLPIGKATYVIGWDTAGSGPEASKPCSARRKSNDYDISSFGMCVSWYVNWCCHWGHWPSMETRDSMDSVLEGHMEVRAAVVGSGSSPDHKIWTLQT
jgi:hypothetical protein